MINNGYRIGWQLVQQASSGEVGYLAGLMRHLERSVALLNNKPPTEIRKGVESCEFKHAGVNHARGVVRDSLFYTYSRTQPYVLEPHYYTHTFDRSNESAQAKAAQVRGKSFWGIILRIATRIAAFARRRDNNAIQKAEQKEREATVLTAV